VEETAVAVETVAVEDVVVTAEVDEVVPASLFLLTIFIRRGFLWKEKALLEFIN
jgi:hypothetical protein